MRGKRSERVILQKIIKYCDEISSILQNHHSSRDEFEHDKEFQLAVGMCIIQIGELVTKLEDSFVSAYPDIPWREIRGMRNVFAHDYDIVDNNMIWETATEDIPLLRGQLNSILNDYIGQ